MFGLGNQNKKIIKKYQSLVSKINHLETEVQALSEEDIKAKTKEFQQQIENKTKTLDELLPYAFAIVREAAIRTLNLRCFDVQLLGGIALHNGMVSEMLTGEGKTLVATLPTYLNSLTKKGVHIITVNDYLAKRDHNTMAPLFKYLGLTTAFITAENNNPQERKQAYKADIIYGTNNEFAFDYLKDNMRTSIDEIAQQELHYAIIDEVDSILVDEARTPLIISGAAQDSSEIYQILSPYAKEFTDDDLELDHKAKNVNLTDSGVDKLEKIAVKAGIVLNGSLFDSNNLQLYHICTQVLRAHKLFHKEEAYIVHNGEVLIIDEFTGRTMEGRRYSDGLHQALEAKERLKIQQENQTLASITYQNYFNMYHKLAGMTGTAYTEKTEFIEIYGLRVLPIPSNLPVKRKDYQDKIYLDMNSKFEAIVEKIEELNKQKRPVLVGTISIERSEHLSKLLKKKKIKHNVLNAKQHHFEADIISQAGSLSAVTIATNMAGRGTDIKLGGSPDIILNQSKSQAKTPEELEALREKINQQCEEEKKQVIELGGLFVLGTERHESRRIDNQLRGRSGRQGEPGDSIFYISLEDDLMRIFGSNRIDTILAKLGFKPGESITHPLITRAIEKAQKKVEVHNFDIRKNLLQFDNVINQQRKIIYEQRFSILQNSTEDLKQIMFEFAQEVFDIMHTNYLPEKEFREQWDYSNFNSHLHRIFNVEIDIKKLALDDYLEYQELIKSIFKAITDSINNKISSVSKETFDNFLSHSFLHVIDNNWVSHLSNLDSVRSSINLRAYGQKNPLHEYQQEAFALFDSMLANIKEQLLSVCCHFEIISLEEHKQKQEHEQIFSNTKRNDPCPCGSKKKFKHCHGKVS